jgi:hypothetical protein
MIDEAIDILRRRFRSGPPQGADPNMVYAVNGCWWYYNGEAWVSIREDTHVDEQQH